MTPAPTIKSVATAIMKAALGNDTQDEWQNWENEAKAAIASLSPAATPGPEAGGEAELCPHALTYDAGLCCGHPDDCTFVSPSGCSKGASATEDGIRAKLLRLAKALHAKHYAHVPQWEPFEDAYGLIDQIDNMTAALARHFWES